MKKKIFYWSPCLNPVGTIKSTINSAASLSKYSAEYEVSIINACGEWDNYSNLLKKYSINIIKLNSNYFRFLPKKGYLSSRFSYLIIYLLSFFSLLKLLRKEQPNIIILHLITSLPLTLLSLFTFKTKFILRISGYPKLNFLRKFFWAKLSKKLVCVTSPTIDLKLELETNNIFPNCKILYLPDAIIEVNTIPNLLNQETINKNFPKNKKVIISVGRLTKQKNFSYLIKEFFEFSKEYKEYVLLIIGDGEEKKNLQDTIKKNNLENKVFLLGYKHNIYDYMKKGDIFVLSSLWEEVGFVMVEAAINNLYIIASDCPNGPKEFLNQGKNGILFKNNTKNQLCKSLLKYNTLTRKKIFFDKLELKKNAKKYTKFRHFIELNKILKLDI